MPGYRPNAVRISRTKILKYTEFLEIIIFVTHIYYITYNYCCTNFVARNYPFYRVDAETFEDLATTVLSEKYKIPFLKFKSGNDAGQDAVAKRVNIDLGGKNILTDQNVVVQVKHTRYETKSFSDKTRKRVFDGGKKKVEKLVNENELDIYIIVTNYELPAGQCMKLEETFKKCGAKEVVVVGNETLTQCLNDSQELQQKVLGLYFSSPSTSSDYLDVAMGDDDITGYHCYSYGFITGMRGPFMALSLL